MKDSDESGDYVSRLRVVLEGTNTWDMADDLDWDDVRAACDEIDLLRARVAHLEAERDRAMKDAVHMANIVRVPKEQRKYHAVMSNRCDCGSCRKAEAVLSHYKPTPSEQM